MPLVFRAMKKSEDGLPTVEQTASGLGVRPGIDIDLDVQGNVEVNGKGMSVAPTLRSMPLLRIPKRLRDKVPGARGSNNTLLQHRRRSIPGGKICLGFGLRARQRDARLRNPLSICPTWSVSE